MSIYTDLALEAREMDPELEGVDEERKAGDGFELTRIRVKTAKASSRLGKRMGNYITIESQVLNERLPESFKRASSLLSSELEKLIGSLDASGSVLIAGLGNRRVTPDSLGPSVSDQILVTRHINDQMPDVFGPPIRSVSAISPGVMGETGIESLEIIKGVCGRVSPDFIIAIDSLAARRVSRIGVSIQLTDAGIDPGAGVGNIRSGLDSETVGIPVIAVGVPLVVYSSTILYDGITEAAKRFGLAFGEEEISRFSREALKNSGNDMIVTSKDIDRITVDMSRVLAEGINRALFGSRYDELVELTN